MQATSRRVYVYYLDIDSTRKDAELPSLSDCLAIWDRRRQAGNAHIQVGAGGVDVLLGDITVDAGNQTATLLFRHSDAGVAESVYSNIRQNQFRPNAKPAGFGGETGAHMLISLANEQGFPRRYTCLVEKVPYLDFSLIRRLLNRILHDEHAADPHSFEYDNPHGQRTRAGGIRRERCLPRIEFEGQPSANLANDIHNGYLEGVTLVRAEQHTQVGGVGWLTRQEATMKLSVDHGNLPANVWAGVRRAIQAEAPDYPTATIRVRPPGSTRSVGVQVHSATGAPIGELYTRSHDIIGINPPMRHSAERVVVQLERLVHPILLRERNI